MTSIRSFIKKLVGSKENITIVSGLPRSGTSMMMSALKAGGMPLLIDNIREADPNNPKGYYEFERVKKLPKGDDAWLDDAKGKAVKVIFALLEYLPPDYHYQVIFMERKILEILSSQNRMLARTGKEHQHPVADETIRESYQNHLSEVKFWLEEKDWIETLYVSYNQILQHPLEGFNQVSAFLDARVDPEAMALVVDPSLYREKK